MKLDSIFSYKHNNKSDTLKISKKLVNFLINYSNNKSLNPIYKDLSYLTDVPIEVIKNETKQIMYKSFIWKDGVFPDYFSINKIIKYFFNYFGLTLLHLFSFFTISKKRKKYDLICDNVLNQLDVDRYSRITKKFKKICFLGSYKYYYKNKNKVIDVLNVKNFQSGCTDYSLSKRISLFVLLFKILKISIKEKINLFYVFNLVVYKILINNSIYKKISARYYITQKFYATSPVHNFFFKKSGGKITSSTQKNLFQLSLSCFIFIDTMFTLGHGQGNICNKLGGKIDFFKPVGSLFMENSWFKKKKDFKNISKTNILILGINTETNDRHHINKDYEITYYKFLNWIKLLSQDFPNKKIQIKHHNDKIPDPKEIDIFKNTNVEILTKDKSVNTSYANAFNSELPLAFGSTMIIELLGHGKRSYYIDPSLKNNNWYHDIKYLKDYRIHSYKKLLQVINKRKKIKLNHKKYFCLNSKNTSIRIANYFKSLKTS